MNAYDAVTAVTKGRDVAISMHVSAFCALFDHQFTPGSRQELLDRVVEWLTNNPDGITTDNHVQPSQVP